MGSRDAGGADGGAAAARSSSWRWSVRRAEKRGCRIRVVARTPRASRAWICGVRAPRAEHTGLRGWVHMCMGYVNCRLGTWGCGLGAWGCGLRAGGVGLWLGAWGLHAWVERFSKRDTMSTAPI